MDKVLLVEHFRKILKERLKDENVTRLCNKLQIPRSILLQWRDGSSSPSFKNIKHLKSLCDYFSMSLEELLIANSSEKLISSVIFSDEGHQFRIKIEKIK